MARKLKYQDFEGDMAKAQLQKIEMYAKKLNDMIHPEDEIESWVQAKLSVVAAYMGDIKHYLDYQLKEFADGGITDEELKPFEVAFKYEIDTERVVRVFAHDEEEAKRLAEQKFSPYYDDFEITEVQQTQQMKHGGITDYFDEAEEYVGSDVWNGFTFEEKAKATEYLRLKGRIGDFDDEDFEDDDDDDDDDFDEEFTDEDFDNQYSEEDTYDIYTLSAMQYAKGGKTDKWIQDAVKHKGALRRTAKREGLIRGDEKLSMTDLKKLEKQGGKTAKRARLAETLRSFGRGGNVLDWANANAETILKHYLNYEGDEVSSQLELRRRGDYVVESETAGDGSKQAFIDICFGDDYDKNLFEIENNYEDFISFAKKLYPEGYVEVLTNDADNTIMFLFTQVGRR